MSPAVLLFELLGNVCEGSEVVLCIFIMARKCQSLKDPNRGVRRLLASQNCRSGL